MLARSCRAPEKGVVQNLALAYWSFHYVKRLLETAFVHKCAGAQRGPECWPPRLLEAAHAWRPLAPALQQHLHSFLPLPPGRPCRFSHATMPILNLFKNCAYYWLFAAYVSRAGWLAGRHGAAAAAGVLIARAETQAPAALMREWECALRAVPLAKLLCASPCMQVAYFVNHPLYTAPPTRRAVAALAAAMLCQFANFRCGLPRACWHGAVSSAVLSAAPLQASHAGHSLLRRSPRLASGTACKRGPPPQAARWGFHTVELCPPTPCPRRCHVILANLRPAGAKGYVIPRGFLFNFITCPNYTGAALGFNTQCKPHSKDKRAPCYVLLASRTRRSARCPGPPCAP